MANKLYKFLKKVDGGDITTIIFLKTQHRQIIGTYLVLKSKKKLLFKNPNPTSLSSNMQEVFVI